MLLVEPPTSVGDSPWRLMGDGRAGRLLNLLRALALGDLWCGVALPVKIASWVMGAEPHQRRKACEFYL